jgi:hypothetical protein
MSNLWLSSISTFKKYPIRQLYIENGTSSLSVFYPLEDSFFEVIPVTRKFYAGGEITVGYKLKAEIYIAHNDFKSGGIIERLDELMAFNTAPYDPYLEVNTSQRKNVSIACGSELIGTAGTNPVPTARNSNDDVLISLSNHGTYQYRIEGKDHRPKLIITYQRTIHSLQDVRLYPSGGSAVKLFS